VPRAQLAIGVGCLGYANDAVVEARRGPVPVVEAEHS
jgi:hypothetical protein